MATQHTTTSSTHLARSNDVFIVSVDKLGRNADKLMPESGFEAHVKWINEQNSEFGENFSIPTDVGLNHLSCRISLALTMLHKIGRCTDMRAVGANPSAFKLMKSRGICIQITQEVGEQKEAVWTSEVFSADPETMRKWALFNLKAIRKYVDYMSAAQTYNALILDKSEDGQTKLVAFVKECLSKFGPALKLCMTGEQHKFPFFHAACYQIPLVNKRLAWVKLNQSFTKDLVGWARDFNTLEAAAVAEQQAIAQAEAAAQLALDNEAKERLAMANASAAAAYRAAAAVGG